MGAELGGRDVDANNAAKHRVPVEYTPDPQPNSGLVAQEDAGSGEPAQPRQLPLVP